MALKIFDRVKETTSTTGTGTITLAGAVTNFETFASNLSDGDTTYYAIVDGANNAFEVGLGTFTASGTTLARTTIIASSNSNNAVDLAAGTKEVFITVPADKMVVKDASGNISSPTITTPIIAEIDNSGDITLDAGGDIILDAGGEQIILKDGSTNVGHIDLSNDNLIIKSLVQDKDLVFQGNDGGVSVTLLNFDVSNASLATFPGGVQSNSFFWMAHDNNVALYGGANFEIALNHVHNTGFKLTNSGTGTPAVELQFVDSNESIGSDGTNLLLKSGGNAITVPNTGADTATLNAATQTLTNKTLTSPTITTPIITEIDSGSSITLDATTDIILDADGGDIHLQDGGVSFGSLENSSSDFVIKASTGNKDIIFKGLDFTTPISALTLDMSDAGKAIFNAGASFSDDIEAKTSDGAILKLETSNTGVTGNDVLGRIEFKAPNDTSGGAAVKTSVSISAVAKSIFGAGQNKSDLVFKAASTGTGDESEKMILEPEGNLLIKGNATLKLETSDTVIVDGNALGAIEFSAPNELSGGEAIKTGASIIAECDAFLGFSATNNQTDLSFKLAQTVNEPELPEIMRLEHEGNLIVKGQHSGAILKLQTTDTTVEDGNTIGAIEFSAPDEASGTDAITTAASIVAEADATFSASNNETDLVIKLGKSETALERARFRHEGGLKLTGYDADNAPDPTLTLFRDTASPAANDFIGNVYFSATNSAAESFIYGAILAKINDPTDGTEDGQIVFRVAKNGTEAWQGAAGNIISITPNTLSFAASSGTTFNGHDITNVGSLSTTGDITAKTSDGAILKLQTSDTTVVDGDVLGAIEFSAPDEASGGDAITTAFSIIGEADSTYSSSSNAADLVFKANANEVMRLEHTGDMTIARDLTLTNSFEGFSILKEAASGTGTIGWKFRISNPSGTTNNLGISRRSTNGGHTSVLEITNSGHIHPAANNQQDLGESGTAFRNAYLSGTLETGNDITAKSSDGAILKLQTSDTTVEDGDVIGAIEFSAPDEASGGVSDEISAAIVAEADITFSSADNDTDLVFKVGTSGAATEKMRLEHEGTLVLQSAKITGLADPTKAQEAATKAYVDTNAGGISTGKAIAMAMVFG